MQAEEREGESTFMNFISCAGLYIKMERKKKKKTLKGNSFKPAMQITKTMKKIDFCRQAMN
jgi:hypothetical protein